MTVRKQSGNGAKFSTHGSGKIVQRAYVCVEFVISGAFSFVLSFCVKRKDKIKKSNRGSGQRPAKYVQTGPRILRDKLRP